MPARPFRRTLTARCGAFAFSGPRANAHVNTIGRFEIVPIDDDLFHTAQQVAPSPFKCLAQGAQEFEPSDDGFSDDVGIAGATASGCCTGDAPSARPAVSRFGRFIAFQSEAENLPVLDPGPGNGSGPVNHAIEDRFSATSTATAWSMSSTSRSSSSTGVLTRTAASAARQT